MIPHLTLSGAMWSLNKVGTEKDSGDSLTSYVNMISLRRVDM